MDRAAWTPLTIAAANGEGLAKVQLQKALFVLGRNLPSEVGEPYYCFVPCDFGAFARAAYDYAAALAAQGFVAIREAGGPAGTTYVVTLAGLERAKSVRREASPMAVADLQALVGWVRRLTSDELVQAVGAEYLETRENTSVRAGGRAKPAPLPPMPDERAPYASRETYRIVNMGGLKGSLKREVVVEGKEVQRAGMAQKRI